MANPHAQRHEQRFLLERFGAGVRENIRSRQADAGDASRGVGRKGTGLVLQAAEVCGKADRGYERKGAASPAGQEFSVSYGGSAVVQSNALYVLLDEART